MRVFCVAAPSTNHKRADVSLNEIQTAHEMNEYFIFIVVSLSWLIGKLVSRFLRSQ